MQQYPVHHATTGTHLDGHTARHAARRQRATNERGIRRRWRGRQLLGVGGQLDLLLGSHHLWSNGRGFAVQRVATVQCVATQCNIAGQPSPVEGGRRVQQRAAATLHASAACYSVSYGHDGSKR